MNNARADGTTPLYMAAQNGHDSTVAQLLAAGADANGTAEHNVTALMLAARTGSVSGVRALLAPSWRRLLLSRPLPWSSPRPPS